MSRVRIPSPALKHEGRSGESPAFSSFLVTKWRVFFGIAVVVWAGTRNSPAFSRGIPAAPKTRQLRQRNAAGGTFTRVDVNRSPMWARCGPHRVGWYH